MVRKPGHADPTSGDGLLPLCIMVLDGAGWHHASDLRIPPNMALLFLPPYSPELNPV